MNLSRRWGANAARARWGGFERWGARLPYFSAAIVMMIGTVIFLRGAVELGLLG